MRNISGRMAYEGFCTLRCAGQGRDDLRIKSDGSLAEFPEFCADLGDAMHNVNELGLYKSNTFIFNAIRRFLLKYPRCVEVMSFSAGYVGKELEIPDFAAELRGFF